MIDCLHSLFHFFCSGFFTLINIFIILTHSLYSCLLDDTLVSSIIAHTSVIHTMKKLKICCAFSENFFEQKRYKIESSFSFYWCKRLNYNSIKNTHYKRRLEFFEIYMISYR
ncbi:MAG: hypothetical protein D6734_05925 [Candidatus Schekmanbacteria bacterium]|nr:MAG: hypothetical protein D6734_05925 [Candidatus Schekmanbacteria bacterium]